MRVGAGRLRIVATNVGRLTHNLKIVQEDEEDREAPPTSRSAAPARRSRARRRAFTFEDLEPGEYRMVCTIANHDDLGQYGELIVEQGGGRVIVSNITAARRRSS